MKMRQVPRRDTNIPILVTFQQIIAQEGPQIVYNGLSVKNLDTVVKTVSSCRALNRRKL